jgi:trigger factor
VKSDVETLNPTRVKLTVQVPFAELKPSVDAAYRSIGSQVQVPGFRKGKVPPRIIDQRFGRGMVLQEAINEALPKLYQQAVEETSVRPVGQPQVDVTDVPDTAAGDEGELRFTAEVDVRPTLELPDFATLAVTVDDVEVTDADVEEQLEQLRVRFGTLVGVERPVETGDFVSLDLRAAIGDEEIDTATGISYEVGSGTMLPGLDEALVGAAAGEERSFTAPLAGGEHAGEDADVTVTVQSVKVRELPEPDDDFAQLASEFDTLAELQADLREKAGQEKVFAQGVQARDKVLEALLEAVEVPVPDGVVEEEVHRHLENEDRLEDDVHRAEVTEEARSALRTQFLLDAVAEQEQVSVAQDELIEYIVAQAPRYGMDPNSFAQAMDQAGQVPAMVAEVARRKALAAVLERATVTDASGAKVELGEPDPEREGAPTEQASAEAAQAAEVTEAATPAAEAPEAADAPAADAPAAEEKPKRTRKPKAEATADAEAPAAEAAEEKPKRTRKPKAETAATAEAAGTTDPAI